MRILGLLLVLIALVLPLVWYIPLMNQHDPIALFSQYLGSAALIAMGLSQFLAIRLRWQQMIFGGLDQIYRLHKWLGIIAIVTVLLHDTIDAEMDGLGRETLLVELAETLGELSLYGLLILVVISIATYIPYHIWFWTHRFMGAFFAASAFHYIFILKPFSNFDPLGLYVGGFCLLGILSYLITLLPSRMLRGRSRYKVAGIDQTGEAIAVSLEPAKRGIRHRPGQFAFVKFAGRGRDEVHPFTISKSRDAENNLRFTFKPLGDYTKRLTKELRVGDDAFVSPAYGHFTRGGKKPEVWIAGGIGVTPFVAFAQELDEKSPPIHFYYCVSDASNAAHLQDFENVVKRLPDFHFHLIETKREGRLTINKIESTLGEAMSEVTVYYCGPKGLRDSLQKGFIDGGLSPRKFKYEEFEIRSGIVITPLLNMLAKLFVGTVGKQLKKTDTGTAKSDTVK